MENFSEKKYALVIDDEDAVRQYLKFALEMSGFMVTLCGNGIEGLKHFYSRKYDIVITDIVMPEKDGIEAIIEMRRIFPPVPIIAISGVDSRDTLFKIANIFQADATLKKPFSLDELNGAVAKALAGLEKNTEDYECGR